MDRQARSQGRLHNHPYVCRLPNFFVFYVLVQPAPFPVRTVGRPIYNLPCFDGNLMKWKGFWEAFEAEIHSDPNTANINKFNYLIVFWTSKSSVAGLTPSNENYRELVNLLTDRYGSNSKLVAVHMNFTICLDQMDPSTI